MKGGKLKWITKMKICEEKERHTQIQRFESFFAFFFWGGGGGGGGGGRNRTRQSDLVTSSSDIKHN